MSNKVYRDAITGQYVSEEYARRNPRTTVSETIKPKSKDSGNDKNKKEK
jgi:hypothetical protein